VLIQAKQSCTAQMVEAYRATGEAANIIAVEQCRRIKVSSYGVVGVGERKGKSFRITGMVEKPKARGCAVQSHHHGALHSPAGDLRSARDPSRRARAARSS
jgi:UTP-glucose-1-phosphate uridylyltransferase